MNLRFVGKAAACAAMLIAVGCGDDSPSETADAGSDGGSQEPTTGDSGTDGGRPGEDAGSDGGSDAGGDGGSDAGGDGGSDAGGDGGSDAGGDSNDAGTDADAGSVCTGVTCGTNAVCDGSSGTATCVCTSGNQDKDGNGDCSADCANTTCGANAACDDSSGTATCACTSGNQDKDGNGDCSADCANTTCGTNAACDDSSGTATCACTSGNQDEDGDGNCSADCANTACVHGTCEQSTGTAVCGCDLGWDGAACDTCGAAFTGADCDQCAGGFTNAPSCDACDTGRFGANCDACPTCVNGTCDEGIGGSGACECDNGFAGTVCDTCETGYTGAACDTCAAGFEDTGVGSASCVSCQAGFYGPSCDACPACVNGSCNDGIGNDGSCECDNGWTGALCDTCDTGYAGAACDTCDTGYQDFDLDGVCEPDCGGGTCDGLQAARGLATGPHDFVLRSGSVPLYVDGDTDGGAWILIGRGREGWEWNEDGTLDWNAIKDGLQTPSAFAPAYLASGLIQGLIDNTTGSPTFQDLEIRLRRAADPFGTEWQRVDLAFPNQTSWSWLFDSNTAQFTLDATVGDSALGAGGSGQGNLRDIYVAGPNDHTRIFTWAWANHNSLRGFSYGSTVGGVENDSPMSFMWEYTNESHAIPYTEVYVRLPTCSDPEYCGPGAVDCDESSGPAVCTCDDHYDGPRCDVCSAGNQDNDGDGVCEPACEVDTCPNAGEFCTDELGTVECVEIDGANCLEILEANPGASDGFYMLDPDGDGLDPALHECDMTSGGYTLLAVADGSSTYFGNNSPGWAATTPVGTVGGGALAGRDYKSQAYTQLASRTIRLCYQNTGFCHDFLHDFGISLQSFFENDISYDEYAFNIDYHTDVGSDAMRTQYLADLGVSAPTRGCYWLGINEVAMASGIGLMGDSNGGCQNSSSNPWIDDLAVGVGLQSCADQSGCSNGGSNNTAGRQFGWAGNLDTGPWQIWALPQPAADCAEILARNPKAGDNTYTIDPDGPGGSDPFQAYCDMSTDGGGWTQCANIDEVDAATNTLCVEEAAAYVDYGSLLNYSFCALFFDDAAPGEMMVHNRTVGSDTYAEGDRVFVDWSADPIVPGTYDNKSVVCEHLDADGSTVTPLDNCQYSSHNGNPWQNAAWSFTRNGLNNGYTGNDPSRVILGPTFFDCSGAGAGGHWYSFAGGFHSHTNTNDWGYSTENVGDFYMR